jgi:hypothetical protein
LRSCTIDLISPAASRTRRASGAVSPPAWLAAALAALSACSLPQTPECPGTHLNSTSISFSFSAKNDSAILRRRSRPLFALFPILIASRASWLSEKIVIRVLVAKSGSSCGSGSNDSYTYSSAAAIAAISAVRMPQVVDHPIDSCTTTSVLSLRRRATAMAAHRAITEASEYRLAIPALAIEFASLIARSLSEMTTLNPRLTHVAWIQGGFSLSGRLAICFSLSVTAESVVSSGEAYRRTP